MKCTSGSTHRFEFQEWIDGYPGRAALKCRHCDELTTVAIPMKAAVAT